MQKGRNELTMTDTSLWLSEIDVIDNSKLEEGLDNIEIKAINPRVLQTCDFRRFRDNVHLQYYYIPENEVFLRTNYYVLSDEWLACWYMKYREIVTVPVRLMSILVHFINSIETSRPYTEIEEKRERRETRALVEMFKDSDDVGMQAIGDRLKWFYEGKGKSIRDSSVHGKSHGITEEKKKEFMENWLTIERTLFSFNVMDGNLKPKRTKYWGSMKDGLWPTRLRYCL